MVKIKRKLLVRIATVAFLIGGFLNLFSVSGFARNERTKSKNFRQTKISKVKAREIAQAKVPDGKIEGAELEREHGKLVYSFDIRNAKGTITEVQVDARNGKIVSVKEESKEDEAREKQEEMKKNSKKKP